MSNPTISKGFPWANGATVMPTRLNETVDEATIQCTKTNVLIGRRTSGAGEAEELEYAFARCGTQFDKTDTTLANVTDMSVDVTSGSTYKFEVWLYVNQNATGQSKIALSGTCTVSALIAAVIGTEQTIFATKSLGRITALDSAIANTSSSVSATFYHVAGTLVASGTGTLTVQFAQNSASGTSSVLVGSWMSLSQIA